MNSLNMSCRVLVDIVDEYCKKLIIVCIELSYNYILC